MADPGATDRLPSSRLPTVDSAPPVPVPQPDGGDGSWPRHVARSRPTVWAWLRSVLLTLFLLVPAALFLIAGAVLWQARTDEARPADAIVVLGAAQYNGRPSNVLQARLDHARDLYQRGLAPHIIVTGGRAEGDAYSEAESGYLYLVEQGVPGSAILMESEGTDTWASMQGVAALVRGTDIHRLLIVSDGFHLLRSELMARKLGFEASSSAAPDSPIRPWSGAELAYVIRETGGIVAFLPEMV